MGLSGEVGWPGRLQRKGEYVCSGSSLGKAGPFWQHMWKAFLKKYFYFFWIGGQLLYNVLVVSATHKRRSIMIKYTHTHTHTHTHIPLLLSLPSSYFMEAFVGSHSEMNLKPLKVKKKFCLLSKMCGIEPGKPHQIGFGDSGEWL